MEVSRLLYPNVQYKTMENFETLINSFQNTAGECNVLSNKSFYILYYQAEETAFCLIFKTVY